jgi:hypothetical protein
MTADPLEEGGDTSEPRRVDTPVQVVEPIISMEKQDVQFWLQVAQVVLLYLILRKLAEGGA